MAKSTLALAASSDAQAVKIWEHLFELVQRHGVREPGAGGHSLLALTVGAWTINHWAPHAEPPGELASRNFESEGLEPGEAASPGYRAALSRQQGAEILPYGLDLWRGLKVLSVQWSQQGTFKVAAFIRGDWEDEALALAAPADETDGPAP